MSLELDGDAFRRLAERTVDLAARYLGSLDQKSIVPGTRGRKTQALFGTPLPEKGLGAAAFDAVNTVFAQSMAKNGRFFGYVLGSGEPVAALGDLLASILNPNVTAWRSSPAAVTVERTVVGWLAEAVGCSGFSGSLVGGGSAANLLGLTLAREARAPANVTGAQPGVVYASSEVHMSIPKALSLLGLGSQALRRIPADSQRRLPPGALDRAMAEDTAAGRRIIAVVANAGTVNTGAIDPLEEIAQVARTHGAWLHVDGAYGALASIAAPERFRGLNLADSISLDPHKWLYQPLDVGCVLYRDAQAARAAFAQSDAYVQVLEEDPLETFAFFDESFELSRRFRALKLWLSLRYHGLSAFRDAIRANLDDARALADSVRSTPELEVIGFGDLSAVCFRHRGPANASADEVNAWNLALLQRVQQRGRVYLSNAILEGRFCLRACITNHRTTREDALAVVPEVLAAEKELETEQK